jgi:UDP-N-acetylmuramate--alanine ligase
VGIETLVSGTSCFLVGIKGTGMSSLALLLKHLGAQVSGSDVSEVFSTDKKLSNAHISWVSTNDPEALQDDVQLVIYSAAYHKDEHPQLIRAQQRSLLLYSYPEFLALMSQNLKSYGIGGTHGKTTAAGCCDWILRNTDLPFSALYGSSVQGGTKPSSRHPQYGIFEACEYRDHFLSYHLQGALITSIEHDHPDWFFDEAAVLSSFTTFVSQLPQGAPLICAVDLPAARDLVSWVQVHRPDLQLITYGLHASAQVRIVDRDEQFGEQLYRLSGIDGLWCNRTGSWELCLDTIGSALLSSCMLSDYLQIPFDTNQTIFAALMREAEQFPGTVGRIEQLFVADGITYVDDYAHHPSEIRVSLAALAQKYPHRRLVTIYYPHTVSRTEKFLLETSQALRASDVTIVRSVFLSARQDGSGDTAVQVGKQLADMAQALFVADEQSLIATIVPLLRPEDVCVTMGAGNDAGLGSRIAAERRRITC